MIALLLIGALAAQAATGSIRGTVTGGGSPAVPIRVTFDQRTCGDELPDEAVLRDAQGHLANAVVMLVGVKTGKAKPIEPVIVNEKCRFAPRVQIARPNSTVRTTSRDQVLHTTNVRTESGQLLFNVALPVPGITISKSIGPAGIARITCNTHPWMRGFIVVTDDVAAVTGADGAFGWSDVPVGTYELRVWHETLKAVTQKITVSAGKPTPISIRLE